jgi:hypothetical protein
MSHNGNGKTSFGQNGNRRDGSSADNSGFKKLRSHTVAKPNEVYAFLRDSYLDCLKRFASSGIDSIFGDSDGSGIYPTFTRPEYPVDRNDKVEFEIWKHEFAKFNRRSDLLTDHKIALFATMLDNVSRESYVKIEENAIGREAMKEKCPKKLIEAIKITHMANSKGDPKAQLFDCLELYGNDNIMLKNQSLSEYYTRFQSLVESIKSASNRISTDELMDDSNPSPEMQAFKFAKGLSNNYRTLIDNIDSNLIEMPKTLEGMYKLAANCKIRVKDDTTDEKMLLVARKQIQNEMKMKRHDKNNNNNNNNNNENNHKDKSGGNKNKSSDKNKSTNQNEYGGRKGDCHNCGKPGHYSHECKETVKDSGQKADGGKGNAKSV